MFCANSNNVTFIRCHHPQISVVTIIYDPLKNIFMKIGPGQFCKFKYHYNNKDNIDLDIR